MNDDAQRPLPREHLLFLNDATVEIGRSLEVRQTVRAFGDALVPRTADFAAVYLIDALTAKPQLDVDLPDASDALTTGLRRMVVIHHDAPGRWRHVLPEDTVQVMRPEHPVYEAMVTGRPVLWPLVDGSRARTLAGGQLVEELEPLVLGCSLLAVPLHVRGRMLGAAVLLRHPDRAAISETCMLTVNLLAAQASLGVDNAYRYRAEASLTDTLQRSMLPTLPARLAGLDIAHRYLSSSQTAQVGGDWFDAIELPGGRIALVVGDVMGHSIASAATMGQLRTAVRTLAALDLPPDQVLRHLDDLAQRLGDTYLATCVYAVYEPVTRRCVIANAGHIPPVLIEAGGRARKLDLPTGAPIGVGGIAFESLEVSVADGDVLVMCTDGLVESRGQDIDDGITALCETLGPADLPLDTLCDTLLKALNSEEREDDMALLMARFQGIPRGNALHWFLQPHPTTPARARRLVRTTLREWGLSDYSDIVELLATEVVTNAARYTTRAIELRLVRTDALLCEVADNDHRLPVLRQASEEDENGRGLQLVSNLSRRWGTSRTSSGKVVWFELELPPDE